MIIEPSVRTVEQDHMIKHLNGCGWELIGWVMHENSLTHMEAIMQIKDSRCRILPDGKIGGFEADEDTIKKTDSEVSFRNSEYASYRRYETYKKMAKKYNSKYL